ncbi:MAG TPA: hypothetical protein VNA69_08050 [Thermoanaerobaculia bacterium]|nr:hypothetical protein [Thermoanaerobaculia bacterium]
MRPLALRAAILVVFGAPLWGGFELHKTLHVEHPFRDLGRWVAYCVFLYILIALNVGIHKLVSWVAGAMVLALTVVFSGGIFRSLKIWESLSAILPWLHAAQASTTEQQELDLVFRLIMIMASLPYMLFVVESFPAAEFLRDVVRQGARRRAKLYITLAVFFRIFQHVFEVVTTLLVAWREENPRGIAPREVADLRGAPVRRIAMIDWYRQALWVWAVALLENSLVFVPVAVRDWQQFIDE